MYIVVAYYSRNCMFGQVAQPLVAGYAGSAALDPFNCRSDWCSRACRLPQTAQIQLNRTLSQCSRYEGMCMSECELARVWSCFPLRTLVGLAIFRSR